MLILTTKIVSLHLKSFKIGQLNHTFGDMLLVYLKAKFDGQLL